MLFITFTTSNRFLFGKYLLEVNYKILK